MFVVYGLAEDASLLESIGMGMVISIASLIIAPGAIIGLSFLTIPAFVSAIVGSLLFQYFDMRVRWLAGATGAATGIGIALTYNLLLGAEVNWFGFSNWRDSWEFLLVMAFAGVSGGWFAYPAWFPKQDVTEALQEA